MKKKKTKFFASHFLMVGSIFLLLVAWGAWIPTFIAFLQGGNNVTSREEMNIIFTIFTIFTILWHLLLLIFAGYKAFSIYEISQKGVKRSLYKVLKKREFRWDEIKQIRYICFIGGWLFFSKGDITGVSYQDLTKRKDTLQIGFRPQMLELIREFTYMDIQDLPEQFKTNTDVFETNNHFAATDTEQQSEQSELAEQSEPTETANQIELQQENKDNSIDNRRSDILPPELNKGDSTNENNN